MLSKNLQDSILLLLLPLLFALACSERDVQGPAVTSNGSVDETSVHNEEAIRENKSDIKNQEVVTDVDPLPPIEKSLEPAIPTAMENAPELGIEISEKAVPIIDMEKPVVEAINLFTDKAEDGVVLGVWHENTENIVNSIMSTVSDRIWKIAKVTDGVGSVYLTRMNDESYDLTGKEEWFLNFNMRVTSFAADITTTPFILRLDSQWPNVCDHRLPVQPQFNVWMAYKVKIRDMLDDNEEFFGNNGNCQIENINNPFGLQPDTPLNWSIEINQAFLSAQ